MESELIFEGKKYISSKRLSTETEYTFDYISRLCREGKIQGKLIGRNWFVDPDSLVSYKTVVRNPLPPPSTKNLKNEKKWKLFGDNWEQVLLAPVGLGLAPIDLGLAPVELGFTHPSEPGIAPASVKSHNKVDINIKNDISSQRYINEVKDKYDIDADNSKKDAVFTQKKNQIPVKVPLAHPVGLGPAEFDRWGTHGRWSWFLWRPSFNQKNPSKRSLLPAQPLKAYDVSARSSGLPTKSFGSSNPLYPDSVEVGRAPRIYKQYLKIIVGSCIVVFFALVLSYGVFRYLKEINSILNRALEQKIIIDKRAL